MVIFGREREGDGRKKKGVAGKGGRRKDGGPPAISITGRNVGAETLPLYTNFTKRCALLVISYNIGRS